ncbi:uncharacterized protein [Parasteatoda tepidariorum]|uniref:uncharacterized protein n=1 Tax=Parasteatoda tepidariorum TaxID=114398 RepID=UPI0039BC2246
MPHSVTVTRTTTTSSATAIILNTGLLKTASGGLKLLETVEVVYLKFETSAYKGLMAAAILGLSNSVLYFLSAFFSFRTYRTG